MVREISIGGTPFNEALHVFPLSYRSSSGTTGTTIGPETTAAHVTVTNILQTRGSITVKKEWDDKENQDGLRPEFVLVRLIKDMGAGAPNEIVSDYVSEQMEKNRLYTMCRK
jgi:hypothetical protein